MRRGAGSKRRNAALILDEEDVEDESEPHGPLHANGYARDKFVVSDDDDSDDGFEPMRPPPKRRQRTLDELGAPIARDARLDEASVDPVHADIILAFVQEAKRLEEQLRNKMGLRRAIFTERHFREMAIGWTSSLDKMRRIPDINADHVDKFGLKFIPLIDMFHSRYREMMGSAESDAAAATAPPAHDIVDLISSDDDDNNYNDNDDDDNDDDDNNDGDNPFVEQDTDDPTEQSKYFSGPGPSAARSREVQEWHARLNSLNQAQPASSSSRGRSGSGAGGKSTSWKGGGKRSFPRRSGSGGASSHRGRSASGGVAKRKAPTSRKTGTASGARSKGGRNASRGPGGGGASGIGLMPM